MCEWNARPTKLPNYLRWEYRIHAHMISCDAILSPVINYVFTLCYILRMLRHYGQRRHVSRRTAIKYLIKEKLEWLIFVVGLLVLSTLKTKRNVVTMLRMDWCTSTCTIVHCMSYTTVLHLLKFGSSNKWVPLRHCIFIAATFRCFSICVAGGAWMRSGRIHSI